MKKTSKPILNVVYRAQELWDRLWCFLNLHNQELSTFPSSCSLSSTETTGNFQIFSQRFARTIWTASSNWNVINGRSKMAGFVWIIVLLPHQHTSSKTTVKSNFKKPSYAPLVSISIFKNFKFGETKYSKFSKLMWLCGTYVCYKWVKEWQRFESWIKVGTLVQVSGTKSPSSRRLSSLLLLGIFDWHGLRVFI